LDAWNLQCRSILVWVKPVIGLGVWLRNVAEFCLLATKGNVRDHWYLTNQPNVITGPRREHSRKPDEFYELVDSLVHKDARKLDMFSRESRDGWDTWGAEEAKFDELGPEELQSDQGDPE